MDFTVGACYTRTQIQQAFGGEIQTYLPQRNGRIVAGCFGRRKNPQAPCEIQVGSKPKVVRKAEILAEQSGKRIPVFIKVSNRQGARAWEYTGVYEFSALIADQDALARAEAESDRHGELTYLLRFNPIT